MVLYQIIHAKEREIEMNKSLFYVLFVVLLSSCGLTSADLGFEKTSPDEMLVISRAPLSLPPEFGLRPMMESEDVLVETEQLSSGERDILSQM